MEGLICIFPDEIRGMPMFKSIISVADVIFYSEQEDVEPRSRSRRRAESRSISASRRQGLQHTRPRPSRSGAPSPRPTQPRGRREDLMPVDAIFSAHSDGIMVIIRHAHGSSRRHAH
jgi:hypothetical protein